jgi:hypothetical protein
MVAVIILICCIALMALCIWKINDWDGVVLGWSFTVPVLFAVAVLSINGCAYIQLIDKEGNYEVVDSKIKIQEDRQNNVIEQLKLEAQKYVNYETDLFKSIKPDNAQILLIKYPELKAIEAIRYLMEQIVQLNNDIYALKLSKEDMRATFIKINKSKLLFFSSDYQ